MTIKNSMIPLIVFAKAPIAGSVKTRLQPQLDEHQAGEVAKLLLKLTLGQAIKYWPGKVILSAGLDAADPFLQDAAASNEIQIVPQPNGDLGQRMANTMGQFGYPAAIIGSDIPQISEEALQAAHANLLIGRNVLGPSDDGGYYLVGLVKSELDLFEKIAWGGRQVLAQTLQRATESSVDLEQLPTINDVDTWGELVEAAAELPELLSYLKSIKLL